jgi:ParB family transcriptional regulator, chromosome partitioning protein
VPDLVALIQPAKLQRNPDNPRLIFREEDMSALQASIAEQGILVPLTVYRVGARFALLDGERRWRCALKLGLSSVPVIVQPKPRRLQNIMMMFAIHHARTDWDPLPTALKLADLETEFSKINGRVPSEVELAGLASLSRGEVRRLKKLLNLPKSYRRELLAELQKPRSEQQITVDHVLEATTAAALLRKRDIVDGRTEDRLRKAIIKKFRRGIINNTVAPRKLARLARAVDRREVTIRTAKTVVMKIIELPEYDIDTAFRESVEQVDFQHGVEQLVDRLANMLAEHNARSYKLSPALLDKLRKLASRITRLTPSR